MPWMQIPPASASLKEDWAWSIGLQSSLIFCTISRLCSLIISNDKSYTKARRGEEGLCRLGFLAGEPACIPGARMQHDRASQTLFSMCPIESGRTRERFGKMTEGIFQKKIFFDLGRIGLPQTLPRGFDALNYSAATCAGQQIVAGSHLSADSNHGPPPARTSWPSCSEAAIWKMR